jgi:hypothetical protein
MAKKRNETGQLLPSPLATILSYAGYGLSVWQRRFSASGRPRMPEEKAWVPMAWQLVGSPEGRRTLKDQVMAGMRAWDSPPVYFECADAAFREVGFESRAIAALQELADTARERFVLPEPPRHPPPAEIRPRPETGRNKRPSPAGPRPGPRRPRFDPK